MSTEIAIRPASLPEKMRYAEALAFSGMLPEQYRKTPANVLWAIEYGETIGISPMAAITGVHLIEGKPTASSGLISGLVRRAGHRLRSGYDAATRTGWAEIVRFDDPEFTFRSEWNLDRAIEAELVERGPNGTLIAKDSKGRSKPWKKFYPSMTKARAITEVARDACEEVLFGLHYTPEELGAETDDEGELLVPGARRTSHAVQAEADPWVTAPAPVQSTAAAPAADDIEYAEVVDEQPAAAPVQTMPEPSPLVPFVEAGQIREVGKLLHTKRTPDQTKWNAIISNLVRREITDAKQLTKAEAATLIERLTAEPERDAAPAAGPTPNDPELPAGKSRAMHALFREKGIESSEDKHAFIRRVLGYDIETMAKITRSQGEAVIKALTTGEIPVHTPAPQGIAPSDEGFNEFAALTQMIHDVHDKASFQEAQKAIDAEAAAGSISAEDQQLLRERLAEVSAKVPAGVAS